eukprot:816536_1
MLASRQMPAEPVSPPTGQLSPDSNKNPESLPDARPPSTEPVVDTRTPKDNIVRASTEETEKQSKVSGKTESEDESGQQISAKHVSTPAGQLCHDSNIRPPSTEPEDSRASKDKIERVCADEIENHSGKIEFVNENEQIMSPELTSLPVDHMLASVRPPSTEPAGFYGKIDIENASGRKNDPGVSELMRSNVFQSGTDEIMNELDALPELPPLDSVDFSRSPSDLVTSSVQERLLKNEPNGDLNDQNAAKQMALDLMSIFDDGGAGMGVGPGNLGFMPPAHEYLPASVPPCLSPLHHPGSFGNSNKRERKRVSYAGACDSTDSDSNWDESGARSANEESESSSSGDATSEPTNEMDEDVADPLATIWMTPMERAMLNIGASRRARGGPRVPRVFKHNLPKAQRVSCHQCKRNTDAKDLFYCSHTGKGQRPCRKKFCTSCMIRYLESLEAVEKIQDETGAVDRETSSWICPACKNECTCAACLRQAAKKGKPRKAIYLRNIPDTKKRVKRRAQPNKKVKRPKLESEPVTRRVPSKKSVKRQKLNSVSQPWQLILPPLSEILSGQTILPGDDQKDSAMLEVKSETA